MLTEPMNSVEKCDIKFKAETTEHILHYNCPAAQHTVHQPPEIGCKMELFGGSLPPRAVAKGTEASLVPLADATRRNQEPAALEMTVVGQLQELRGETCCFPTWSRRREFCRGFSLAEEIWPLKELSKESSFN